MKELISTNILAAPGIAELASAGNWAEEFLTLSSDHQRGEFDSVRLGLGEVKWAEEYLENGDHEKLAAEYLNHLDGQAW